MSVGFPEIGDVFVDKYSVKSILGSGGFSRIYHAVQDDLDRDVALKIMRPPIDDTMSSDDRKSYLERVTIRFQQEAKLISKLRSPYTITMFDYGRTEAGLLYMVLEYVHGHSIAELLETMGAVPQRRVVKIVSQVLMSLHEAHAMEMLHRDLKPANIMVYEHLGDPDQVKLLDFGIAKVVGDSHNVPKVDLTSDGNIIGTPRYMSPEQIRGDVDLAPSSDLYSMGLVCYEMLTGRKAIPGNSSLQIITRQIDPDSFSLPKELDVHPRLRQIVNRMLQKTMSKRYATAQDVLNDLEGVDFDRTVPMRIPRPSTLLKAGEVRKAAAAPTNPRDLSVARDERSADPVAVAVLQKAQTKKISLPSAPDPTPEAGDEEKGPTTIQIEAIEPLEEGDPEIAATSSEALPLGTANSSAEIVAGRDRSAEQRIPPPLPASISNEIVVAPEPEDISGELEELAIGVIESDENAEEEQESAALPVAQSNEEEEFLDESLEDSADFLLSPPPASLGRKKIVVALASFGAVLLLLLIVVFATRGPESTEEGLAGASDHDPIALNGLEDEAMGFADEEDFPVGQDDQEAEEIVADWLDELEDDRIISVRAQPQGVRIQLDSDELGEAPVELAVKDLVFPVKLIATYQGSSQERTVEDAVEEIVFEFAAPQPRPTTPRSASTTTSRKTTTKDTTPTRDPRRRFQYRPVDQVD